MDPNYSVLLQDNGELSKGCKEEEPVKEENETDVKLLIATIIPAVLGTIIVVAALAYFIPK